MAIYEWRKFNFFELRSNVDKNSIQIALAEAKITSTTCGNNQIIICDNEGQIHIFYKSWQEIRGRGHESSIPLCSISLQTNLLVTVGNEENGLEPIYKVWNLTKANINTGLHCMRQVKIPMPRPCALAVSDNGQFLAIGFDRGNILLYRGDIGRDRNKTPKSIVAGTSSIVGMAFKQYDKTTQMFVCSNSGVYVFNLISKDKENRLILDSESSIMRCCALQSGYDGQFMVGRDNAIWIYTFDGRGPCYVLEGEKQIVQWFRNNLIIISANKSAMPSTPAKSLITIIDLTNKFIVYTQQITRIVALFIEFGTCFLVSEDNVVHHLSEKDLQSKLELLYKRNLYDIAVRIAKSQELNNEGLSDIYRQYGDHLYNKSHYTGAVEQFIKTIGYLEPSYVIRKFLDSRHIHFLSTYLQALHEKKIATPDHTTLLVNCYTRLNKSVKLEEFFDLYSAQDLSFDVETAANVCRETMAYNQALVLTEKSGQHHIHIDILLNDLNSISEACAYIENLDNSVAKQTLMQYGSQMMERDPESTTKIMKKVCKDSKSNPDDFLFIFADHPDCLLDFLEECTKFSPNLSQSVYNTLIELHLKFKTPNSEKRLMEILMEKRDSGYDVGRATTLCRYYSFFPGLIYLFGEERLSHLIVRYCVQHKDYEELLNCCQRLGAPSLWLQALMGIRNSDNVPFDLIQKILNVITNDKLLSPLQVLNTLAVENGPTLGACRDFFIRAFKKESDVFKREENAIIKFKKDSATLKQQNINVKEQPIEFRGSICDSCRQLLSLPSVHFFCQHSFHQDCIPTFSEIEKDCPLCIEKNHQIMEVLKAQGSPQINHDQFHTILERNPESFSVISEYIGRNLFNRFIVVEDVSETDIYTNWESKSKPQELIESTKPIQNLDVELQASPKTKLYSAIHGSPSTGKKSISNAISKNPFGEEDAELTKIAKNPFEEYDNTKNPFADDDENDYDANLNPFT
uniref:Vacuolar protein sorting-associated protein 11 homolog n=1 Tax=Culicoides sonorensis TaxID=179676 RepID=A0A336K2Y2_CULSO